MKRLASVGLTFATYLIAIVYFFPVLLMFITGFKQESQATVMPPALIFTPTLENFKLVWSSGAAHFFQNSLLVSAVSTAAALLLGVPAAYALAMYRIKRGDDILFWFISTKMLPVVGAIVPVYLVFKNINLLDTQLALIVMCVAMNVPLVVWMMRSFFKDIPYDLIEASQVDGASGIQGFLKITVPIVRPGIVSTGMLCAIFAWNEFLLGVSLTYTNAATMPVYMATFMTQEGLFWAKMSAVATISALPPMILGWFTQKQLVRGMTMGAVKG
ncbi:carbohydrate ABC transporter permease [Paenibacillus sp. MSJ-34]|uniref:carbohydrate ABC transporter permease n=1 Tax=Paenibacillus sp. MSJ-34 TaxID=2841529 RepID=UPI001C125A2A|nr:carbohydrate ABC transporter permease [Paenibacillus sp. MSJ-34]MBU5444642.1 carbohydrate ABC transporter permease [Paenibacillus sp. MSJ-34]